MTEESNIRVVNVIATGRIPTKKKIDIKKVITDSKWKWQIVNEMYSPMLQVRFERHGETNIHRKNKSVCISVWYSGAINIVGVLSLEEAQKNYDKVVKELTKIGILK